MDLKMKSEEITTAGVSWDCDVQDGIVPILHNGQDELQSAVIASFLIKGTVPQIPDAGVPWTDFITEKISFGVLDFYIRDSIAAAGLYNYYPQYDIQNDQLTMSVGRMEDSQNGI